jgi:hypothetical protein
MTARATANAVTMWRALVGVEVMGGEYIADEIAGTGATRQSACRRLVAGRASAAKLQ